MFIEFPFENHVDWKKLIGLGERGEIVDQTIKRRQINVE
jgi:hypothetical protein